MTTEEAIRQELLRYVKACELACENKSDSVKEQQYKHLAHIHYETLKRLRNA